MAWIEIARTGVTSVRLHPWRSIATVLCVVAVLVPYLAGLAICGGLADEAAQSIDAGADLYVTGRQFGRSVPLPLDAADKIAALPGVTSAVPRIVGRLAIGEERHSVVVLGMPPDKLPESASLVDGRWFTADDSNELVVGSALAAGLKVKVDALLPPFYQNRQGERISKVVGIFSHDAPLWQANLMFTSFKTAARLFDQPALATDILVRCRTGSEEELAAAFHRQLHWTGPDGSRLDVRVTSRQELEALWAAAAAHRDGVFQLHWMLALSVAVLAVLVTSAYGTSQRRSEVAVLKAIGWRTDEVLVRSGVEGLLLGLAGAAVSVLIAWVWLRGMNGYGIADLFLPTLGLQPQVRIPCRLLPVPVLIGALLSWIVVTSGSLYATWRTAMTPPAHVLRSSG
ncbi:MAG TPA: FtsX-like permease family protein [Pirellulales bacterium]|nr:FtsX-like permease family protein [Pirellulales bacterium]